MTRQMTLTEYQQKAARTINPKLSAPELTRHALYGLASEVGEVLGLYQKALQGHPLDVTHVRKELGDVLWFVAELATAISADLDGIGTENINKLLARYPERFDEWHSMHRRKGDI